MKYIWGSRWSVQFWEIINNQINWWKKKNRTFFVCLENILKLEDHHYQGIMSAQQPHIAVVITITHIAWNQSIIGVHRSIIPLEILTVGTKVLTYIMYHSLWSKERLKNE